MESFRRGDQLIFHVVAAVNDADNTSRVFFNRNFHAKQIHIELFPITAQHMRYVPIIDWIGEARARRGDAPDRPVYFYINGFPKIGFYKSFSQGVDDKVMFSFEIFLPAILSGACRARDTFRASYSFAAEGVLFRYSLKFT